MARTLQQIEDSIYAAKAAESGLNGLTSTSKFALYRLWIKITALAHLTLELLWDSKAAELNALADTSIAGNDLWYYNKLIEFQYGYELAVIDGALVYLVEDTDAQIIAQVATISQDGILYIKAAKDNAGTLEKLSDDEKTAFESYINAIKFAGTKHVLISTDPDEVFFDITIYYDGKLDLADFKTATEATINAYLNDVGYDGLFRVNRLRDALEAQSGVIDTLFDVIKIKPNSGSYLNVETTYNPSSGYYKVDPASPLSSAIKYIAQ